MKVALAATKLSGNSIFTKNRQIVYYLLDLQRWSFRTDADCESLINAAAARYSQLIGKRLHLRVTTRPYPVNDWARQLDENTPSPLPDWGKYLISEQRHLFNRTLADKLVYIGIEVERKKSFGRKSDTPYDTALDQIMAGPGMDARPVTALELEWLLRRSIALGMPAPADPRANLGDWEESDFAELTDRTVWTTKPYGKTIKVTTELGGKAVTRYTAILTVGRMDALEIPASYDPWIQRAERLSFPVEWSAIIDVQPSTRVVNEMQTAMRKIQSQVSHYIDEHNLTPPLALNRQQQHALAVEDELQSGFNGLTTRTVGWYRLAVSGATEDEALSRAKQVEELYSPQVTIVLPADTYGIGKEFIPGEPLANQSYKRRMGVRMVGAAMPSATALVGDRRGSYIGTTCGASERAVMWDTHRGIEVNERSGLTILAGGLGSGKSTLMGMIIYKTVRRGISTVVLDASGPLGRLSDMPELRDHARTINLLNAEPGTLSPYRVVAEPKRAHYRTDEEWQRARAIAAAQRRSLCIDILSMLLPASIEEMPQTRMAVMKAVKQVGGNYTASTREVLMQLRKLDGSLSEHGATVADFLEEAADMPTGQLIFPSGYLLDYNQEPKDYTLTVLTMPGLALPREGVDRRDQTLDELYSVPLLHLAAWLTQRSIYERPMDERKMVAMDELHVLTASASGRALINRTSRDSRKWNLRALLASQNVADTTTANVHNFLDSVFIGRTEDEEAQKEALDVLRLQRGTGYEQVLAKLSEQSRNATTRSGSREFVFADGMNGIEKISVDLTGVPELARALDTTADPSRLKPESKVAVAAQ